MRERDGKLSLLFYMIDTKKTYDSFQEAFDLLNRSFVKKDENILLHYYADEEHNDIDVLVAVGTKDGIGPGSYSVISSGSKEIVTFVTELPDSSTLKTGDVYVWTNPENHMNYRVYLHERERQIDPILSDFFAVSRETGDLWYVGPSLIRSLKNIASGDDLEIPKFVRFVTQDHYDNLPDSLKESDKYIYFIYTTT
jgi:hypothetical protein